MPLPLILGGLAAIAGAAGVGAGIKGGAKMKKANDTMKLADEQHKKNIAGFEMQNKKTNIDMDKLGTYELDILNSFEKFSDLIEKIQNRPEFKAYSKEGITIPEYNAENLKEVSIGAGVLLGGIGGAAMGTAGGFAAAGATTSAVMALGTASTGTTIASLSGAAATNATLAALGGGAIAAGGGGIALGTTILGAATLGVGLLVGGIIFNVTGTSLSDKADEAMEQMKKAEKEINKICSYMKELSEVSIIYMNSLTKVNKIYKRYLNKLEEIITVEGKIDWSYFSKAEKIMVENTVLLVGLLFNMCKVQLVLKAENESQLNTINKKDIRRSINDADRLLEAKGITVM